jgi:hypothetical protein
MPSARSIIFNRDALQVADSFRDLGIGLLFAAVLV